MQCPKEPPTKRQAYYDYKIFNSTSGLMGCYCRDILENNPDGLFDDFSNIVLDDTRTYCLEWS